LQQENQQINLLTFLLNLGAKFQASDLGRATWPLELFSVVALPLLA
jgi:hypothetical protein